MFIRLLSSVFSLFAVCGLFFAARGTKMRLRKAGMDMKEISQAQIKAFEEAFRADRGHIAAMNAVAANGVLKSAKNAEAVRQDYHAYSLTLDQHGITNQKKSGRCWMFAATNVMRFEVMKKLGLDDFELSQNYLFFYDKLEKSNYFLENILATLKEEQGSRLIAWLLAAPLGDGGQWDMLASLVEKYGVVPKYAMPETYSSSDSSEMNAVLTEKLRGFACALRKAHAAGKPLTALRAMKADMLETVYRMLCICLGCPPRVFDLEVRAHDGTFVRDAGLTPQRFYTKYVGLDLTQYVSLINAPTADKPFDRSYSVRFLGNVEGGRPVRYLNVDIETLKAAALAQLRDGAPVWFGSDVGKLSSREDGIMDPVIFDREDLFGTDFPMTKAERLDYGHSQMTHAMVLQGVNIGADGRPNRWRVENSWGKDRGQEGYYLMSDRWFDEFLYQIVVNRKYLSAAQLAAYEAEPVMLEPWDPMGSLAVLR